MNIYDESDQARSKIEEFIKEDVAEGRYKTFAQMCVLENDSEAARNYATWCVESKGKWVRFCEKKKRLRFYYIEEGGNETHRDRTQLSRHDRKHTKDLPASSSKFTRM